MTKSEFRKIRMSLGLTQGQLADILGFAQTNYITSFESRATSGRDIPPLVARLMRAYRDGYRPRDWPTQQETAA